MRDKALWERIAAVRFDDETADLAFTDRLARDNRWHRAYAARVIEEYRRFVYLAVKAGHEVTPSDEVDQAWHLHLTYTRHYWDVFCKGLGGPLHHGPTSGGATENRRYRDNYAATLASYQTVFGEAAPTDIWPPADVRFGAAPFMARLNTAENLIVPRKILYRLGAFVAGVSAVGGLVASAAFAAGPVQDIVGRLQSVPPALWIVIAVVGVLIALAARADRRPVNKRKDGSGCSGAGGCGGKAADGDGASGCGGGCGGCGGS